MKLDELVTQFQDDQYEEGSIHQQLTLETSKIINDSELIGELISQFNEYCGTDINKFISILFTSGFTLGRLYEIKK